VPYQTACNQVRIKAFFEAKIFFNGLLKTADKMTM
jgi:hypothetical protein